VSRRSGRPAESAPSAAGTTPSDLVWKSVKVPGYGAFRFHIPMDWEVTPFVFGDPTREPVDVQLWPMHGNERDSEIHVSIQTPRKGLSVPALSTIRKDVESVRDAMLPSAQTPPLTLQEMDGRSLTAYYFSMTDRSAAPSGGWRYMTYGKGLLGEFVLTFTLYNNKETGHHLVPLLVMMRDMEREPNS
jgi:hypothetical protein